MVLGDYVIKLGVFCGTDARDIMIVLQDTMLPILKNIKMLMLKEVNIVLGKIIMALGDYTIRLGVLP